MNEKRLPVLEDFPARATDTVRYADTDRQGHVNNAVFSTFLETGRVMFLLGAGQSLAPPGTGFVIARLELDYHAELTWPGQVEIGTRLLRLGRSSFTFAQGIFQNGRCAASAVTVIVLMNEATRRSTPLPSDLAEELKRLSGKSGV